jgi:hypothetical protein
LTYGGNGEKGAELGPGINNLLIFLYAREPDSDGTIRILPVKRARLRLRTIPIRILKNKATELFYRKKNPTFSMLPANGRVEWATSN